MKLVLVGQPNSGKSTIFNAVAGYKSATANFPGTSATFTTSTVRVGRADIELVDLPGTYSLVSADDAERVTLDYLLGPGDGAGTVLVDVIDATRLGRSLELTLQLIELGRPLVVALNMADEAQRKGIEIDAPRLSRELGVPVVVTIARRGLGLAELFAAALGAGRRPKPARAVRYDNEIEAATARIESLLGATPRGGLPPRLAALRLLERDRALPEGLVRAPVSPGGREIEQEIAALEAQHGWPGEQIISGARHALAHRIEDKVARAQRPHYGVRERLDLVFMHPVLGIPVLLGILALFFWAVFGLGKLAEAPLVAVFDRLVEQVGLFLPPDSTVGTLLRGIILGVSGGVAIVLPFLLPFLLGLAALEDSGYLPRMAYLLDGVMHRLGLHGKSIVPLMLGYGCSVPAVMATRILESPRDRRITAALTVLVPCSARTTVILGVVGALLGFVPALAIYVANLAVIAVLGVTLQKRLAGEPPPGLVLEVPDLRPPSLRTMGLRTWIALKEFILVAWPALIVSSVVLGLLEVARLDRQINALLAPMTVGLLGLPAAVGLTLVFGILRKELAVIMLAQALGTTALATVLTPAQMMSFALFVVFYVPCIATLAALWRELGWKDTAWITALATVLAFVLAAAGRLAVAAFY